jgi:hypothetical protein
MAISYPRPPNPEKDEDFEKYHRISDDLQSYIYELKKKDKPLKRPMLDRIGHMRKETAFIRGDFKRANEGMLPSDFEDVEKRAETVDRLVDLFLEEKKDELVMDYKKYSSIPSEEAQSNIAVIRQYYTTMLELGLKTRHHLLEAKKNYRKLKISLLAAAFFASNLFSVYLAKPDWFEKPLNKGYQTICSLMKPAPRSEQKEDRRMEGSSETDYSVIEGLEKAVEGHEALRKGLYEAEKDREKIRDEMQQLPKNYEIPRMSPEIKERYNAVLRRLKESAEALNRKYGSK